MTLAALAGLWLSLSGNAFSAGTPEYECPMDGENYLKTGFFAGNYVSAGPALHEYVAKERERAKGVVTGVIEYDDNGTKRRMDFNLSAKEGTYLLEVRVDPSITYQAFAAVPCGKKIKEGNQARIAFDFVNVRNADASTVSVRMIRFVFDDKAELLTKLEYVSYREFYRHGGRSSRLTASYPLKPAVH